MKVLFSSAVNIADSSGYKKPDTGGCKIHKRFTDVTKARLGFYAFKCR